MTDREKELQSEKFTKVDPGEYAKKRSTDPSSDINH